MSNIEEDFNDDEIEHEEMKDDDPSTSNTNGGDDDEIPALDAETKSDVPDATTSANATQAQAIIAAIQRELLDSEGTMTLYSIFDNMLTTKELSTMTMSSFKDGCAP